MYICYTYTAFDMKSIMQLSRCVDRWYIYIYTHVSRKLLKVAKCLANCGGPRMDGLTRFPLTLCIIWRNHCQGNAHWDNQREKETLLILTFVAMKLAPLRDIRMSRLRADLWRRHSHVVSLAGAAHLLCRMYMYVYT